MKKEDYWKLFWVSGMPEAFVMSRREHKPEQEAPLQPNAKQDTKPPR